MPTPSADAIRALLTRWSDDALIYLLTLTHPALPVVRWARNNEAVSSNGETFQPAPFDIKWPDDNENLPSLSIVVPNVDRDIGHRVMAINTGIEATLSAVFASDTSDIWKEIRRLELHDVTIAALTVQGTLSHRRVEHEPFPNRRVIPNKFFAYYR